MPGSGVDEQSNAGSDDQKSQGVDDEEVGSQGGSEGEEHAPKSGQASQDAPPEENGGDETMNRQDDSSAEEGDANLEEDQNDQGPDAVMENEEDGVDGDEPVAGEGNAKTPSLAGSSKGDQNVAPSQDGDQ